VSEDLATVRRADIARAAAFRARVGLDSLIDVHAHFVP
jgi:hypothetical protein